MNRFTTIGAMAVFGAMAAGCNSPTPVAQVKQDVANAQQDRSNNVAEARREGNKDVNAQQRDVNAAKATKDYEVALAKVEGDYQVADTACNVLAGTAQADCKDQATAARKADKSNAELLKPKG